MATKRIVSKKELEDSGLSLRDFLNKEQGLTRKPDADTKFGVNKPRDLYTISGKATVDRQDAEAKVAANTAADQATIDRMANRKRPYLKDEVGNDLKRGGAVKKMASGGSASSRADGIAQRGKTRGKMC